MEEAVEDRTGAADVGAEGAVRAQLRGERGGLLDVRAPAGSRVEEPEGVADDRVGGEPVDRRLARGLDPDSVAEIDALEHGRELVLAVGAQRPDDEREVDLRRRGPDHSS